MTDTKGSTTSRGIEWRVIRYDSSPKWFAGPTMVFGVEYKLPGERYFHPAESYFEDTGRRVPATIRKWAQRVAGGKLRDDDFELYRLKRRNPRTPWPGHVPASAAWLKNFEREFGSLNRTDQRRIVSEVRAEQRRMKPVKSNPGKRKLGWKDPALQAAWRDATRILGREPFSKRGRR